MTWAEVIIQIRGVVDSGFTKDAGKVLGALDTVERLIRVQMPQVIAQPDLILVFSANSVVAKLQEVQTLSRVELEMLDLVFKVVSGEIQAKPETDSNHSEPKRKKGHKLQPIADCICEIFEQLFNRKISYSFEAQPEWLISTPDHKTYECVWNEVSQVYKALVDGQWTLASRLEAYKDELKLGRQRADIWFGEPVNCMLEFDETQHFNQYRLKTLEGWQDYSKCAFDVTHYKALSGAVTIPPGTTGFQRLKRPDPLFPPMLNGEAQDNRMRQRAFRDFLKDITPFVVPNVNPTIRVSYLITNGRIRDFTEEDLGAMGAYFERCEIFDKIRLIS